VFARSGWLLLDDDDHHHDHHNHDHHDERDHDDLLHRTHYFGTDASRFPGMTSKFCVVAIL
jgi:hypothetical protein